jgi:hypothetical protein
MSTHLDRKIALGYVIFCGLMLSIGKISIDSYLLIFGIYLLINRDYKWVN